MEEMTQHKRHYLDISMHGQEPNWARAHERLDSLSDEQIAEALHLVGEHDGSGVSLDSDDPKEIRERLSALLDSSRGNVFGQAEDPLNFAATWMSDAGYWQSRWHKALFALSALGLLQAAGYNVEGYNIPVITPDMPVDYWPPSGLRMFWRP